MTKRLAYVLPAALAIVVWLSISGELDADETSTSKPNIVFFLIVHQWNRRLICSKF